MSSSSSITIEDPFDSNFYTNNHIKKEKYSSLIPADPVSIDLANKLAQRAKVVVPEEQIAYGFKKVPANAKNVKPVPNIPEERLSTYEKNVVELKQISCHKHKSEEEEDEEEEEEEQDAKPDCVLGYLNLNQMGYHPQKHVEPQFAVAQFEAESTEPGTPCDKEPIQEIGSCGYKPGRIVDNTYNEDLPAYVVSSDDDDNYDD